MKKIIVILIFFLSFLLGNINEHKTDFYFANGINTIEGNTTIPEEGSARDTWANIVDKLISLDNQETKQELFNFKLKETFNNDGSISYLVKYLDNAESSHIAYNQTVSTGSDILEALSQKVDLTEINTNQLENILKENIFYGIKIIDNIESILNKTRSRILAKVKSGELILSGEESNSLFKFLESGNEYEIIDILKMFQTLETTDRNIQINGYKESIESGHKVVVLSHSQGNLYTEKIYQELNQRQ